MKERPILFSGPMVKAILDGRKTQTRRVCKKAQFENDWAGAVCKAKISGWVSWYPGKSEHLPEYTKRAYQNGFECPHGKPGDRLWVRETWSCEVNDPRVFYRADNDKVCKWKPSIYMPREYSRITLEIVGVRVERLNDITEQDAIAEGSQIPLVQLPKSCQQATMTERDQFSRIWDSINSKKHPWASNPWVWVVEFNKIKPTNIQV